MSRPLAVLHVSTADNEGGSGRSAYRIHDGLRRLGHTSHMLVGTRTTDDPDVDTVHGGGLPRLADRLAEEATRRLGLQYWAYPSSRRVLAHPWARGADIIQLYNTHGGYFSHRLLPRLSALAPIVWRLSDLWPLTGHCAYPGACDRWLGGCGPCPDLAAYPPLARDTTGLLWRDKRKLYSRCRLTVVAPSSWTEDAARRSPLFAGCAVHRIPNGLDLEVFRPLERRAAAEVLGLDPDRPAILFSANVVDDNPRKGSGLLMEALNRLGRGDEVQVLLAGLGGERWRGRIPQHVVPLGYLRDDRLIAAANAAAHMVVVPSVAENLPNTILEAMACGRPVIAFDSGGIRDAVADHRTGLLVPNGDAEALAAAMAALLDDPGMRRDLGEAALDTCRAEYDSRLQARRFEELYADLTASPSPARATRP